MKAIFLLIFLVFSTSVLADHYVLVAGKNITNISRVMPSSLNTVTQNTTSLKRELLDLSRKYAEPMVIVAHSKGGLEVAQTLARNIEDFPREIVRLVIYANVPFQGSPYMAESVRDFESQYGWGGNQFNPLYRSALAVLKSLTTEVISQDLQDCHRDLTVSQKKELSGRSYYLRTQKEENKVSVILKKSAAFLRSSGPNDGLIPVSNMMRADFGVDLGIFHDVDHTDLFVRKWRPDSAQEEGLDVILKNIPGLFKL